MTTATADTIMLDPSGSGKLELKLQEWNQVVSDETQCMLLSREDEIKLLSSRNANCIYIHLSFLRRTHVFINSLQ